MAHGFLSYQDSRGKSGIERALEDYLEKKFKDLKDHLLKERKKTDQKIEEVSVKVEGPAALGAGQQPLLSGGNQKAVAAAPLQRMLGGTALQKSIAAGPSAVNPDVYGGGLSRGGFNGRPLKSEGFVSDRIVNVGSTDLGVDRDFDGDDMFVKRMAPVGGGDSGEVVQAIDRLTMVTMGLVAATKQQTQVQQQIAQTQQQEAEKLGRKSLAASEEFSLEQGGDFSNNAAYMGLGANGMALMGAGGGSRRGGGPGMGFGGKAMAARLGRSVMRRGGARAGTRLGIALGGRMGKGLGKSLGKKLGGKAIGKLAGGALAKSLGKKIPLVGLGLGAVFAAQRALQGDFLGAGLELASGAASTIPGAGTAASVGIDAALAAKDMTSFSEGGIPTGDNVVALLNDRPDKKREAVLPLTDKTFLDFGEGILNAQKKNKNTFARLQADGMAQYYDKQGGWAGFTDGLIKVFRGLSGVMGGEDGDGFLGPRWMGIRNPFAGRGNNGVVDAPDLKTAIRQLETGDDYGSMYNRNRGTFSRGKEDITKMTIDEVDQLQTDYLNHQKSLGYDSADGSDRSAAMGAYQMIEVLKVAKALKIDTSKTKFDKETQDKMSEYYLNISGYQDFKSGEITAEEFNNRLAGQFASVKTTDGTGVHDGDGMNNAYGNIMPLLKKLQTKKITPKTSDNSSLEQPVTNEGSKGILRNFGAKTGERIHFMHNGMHYNAFKLRGTGFDLYKGKMRVETADGQNDDVVDSFLKHVTKGENEDLQSSITSDTDTGAEALNNASTDVIASADTGNTIITNNNYNTSGDKSSGGGDDVALGTNFDGMGPNSIFTTMAFRAA